MRVAARTAPMGAAPGRTRRVFQPTFSLLPAPLFASCCPRQGRAVHLAGPRATLEASAFHHLTVICNKVLHPGRALRGRKGSRGEMGAGMGYTRLGDLVKATLAATWTKGVAAAPAAAFVHLSMRPTTQCSAGGRCLLPLPGKSSGRVASAPARCTPARPRPTSAPAAAAAVTLPRPLPLPTKFFSSSCHQTRRQAAIGASSWPGRPDHSDQAGKCSQAPHHGGHEPLRPAGAAAPCGPSRQRGAGRRHGEGPAVCGSQGQGAQQAGEAGLWRPGGRLHYHQVRLGAAGSAAAAQAALCGAGRVCARRAQTRMRRPAICAAAGCGCGCGSFSRRFPLCSRAGGLWPDAGLHAARCAPAGTRSWRSGSTATAPRR